MERSIRTSSMIIALVSAFLGVIPAAGASGPPLTHVSCGQHITHSITVANDLACSGSDGLDVWGDGVTIDLGGNRIEGEGSGGFAGVRSDGYKDVTIRNGTVLNWPSGGIVVSNATDVTIRDVLATANHVGIEVDHSHAAFIRHNVVENNDGGIELVQSEGRGTTVSHNTVVDNGQGIIAEVCPCGSINSNVVEGNFMHGIFVAIAHGMTIASNTISANGDHGLEVEGSTGDQITDNVSQGNRGAGIHLDTASSAGLIKGNTTNQNNQGGIFVEENTTKIRKNTAKANGYPNGAADPNVWGIAAGLGTPGSGNVAKDNAGRQCHPLSLC